MKAFSYQLHRAALLPLLESSDTRLSAEFLATFRKYGEEAFAGFVLAQGLAPLWHERLVALPDSPFSSAFQQRLLRFVQRLKRRALLMWSSRAVTFAS